MAKRKFNFDDISTTGENVDAFFTLTPGETVINFGDLTTTGDLANGIFAGADDITIRHFGSIETSGLGAAGIFVQGDDAVSKTSGRCTQRAASFGNFAFFSEGIFAEGDRFYIANHGSVQVSGGTPSALVGDGDDGLIINFGALDSFATISAVVAVIGDRSQAINAGSGEVTVHNDFNTALNASGEDFRAQSRTDHDYRCPQLRHGRGFESVDLTNRGVISILEDADFSVGMAALGDGHSAQQFRSDRDARGHHCGHGGAGRRAV